MEMTQNYLLLHGGTDINPARYGQKANRFTQHPDLARDEREFNAVSKAIANSLPVIGICRGAQLLCVANGGKLWQDTFNHGVHHPLTTVDGYIRIASSSHHQVMNLDGAGEHELLAWDDGDYVWGEDDKAAVKLEVMPEVVWFSKTKCLAIQPHPEWELPTSPFRQWLDKKVVELLGFSVDF